MLVSVCKGFPFTQPPLSQAYSFSFRRHFKLSTNSTELRDRCIDRHHCLRSSSIELDRCFEYLFRKATYVNLINALLYKLDLGLFLFYETRGNPIVLKGNQTDWSLAEHRQHRACLGTLGDVGLYGGLPVEIYSLFPCLVVGANSAASLAEVSMATGRRRCPCPKGVTLPDKVVGTNSPSLSPFPLPIPVLPSSLYVSVSLYLSVCLSVSVCLS